MPPLPSSSRSHWNFWYLESSYRTVIPHALHLARRVLDVGLHQPHDRIGDGDHGPGPLRPVGHEEVITLLGVLIEVEYLGNGGDILFCALPAKIGVHRQPAGQVHRYRPAG